MAEDDYRHRLFIYRVQRNQAFFHTGTSSLIQELSLVCAAFCLGIVANFFARLHNQIAIASVFAGLVWLMPGGIGLRGAVAMISNDGGTDFGIQIILRTLSISVGLYLSNLVMFPMSYVQRAKTEDEIMAI